MDSPMPQFLHYLNGTGSTYFLQRSCGLNGSHNEELNEVSWGKTVVSIPFLLGEPQSLPDLTKSRVQLKAGVAYLEPHS